VGGRAADEGARGRGDMTATGVPAPSDAVERMLEARSIAVVGASIKDGSLGRQMMVELRRGGFPGRIYPVNPGYDEVDGLRCYPATSEIPEPVDLAILGVANARIEAALEDAARAGARSATTFASLQDEADGPASRPPLTARVAAIAEQHGMAFCGGNGMGFLNLERRLRATGFATPDDLPLGPVTFLSHSGSAFAAVIFSDRIRCNLVISSGQELVTTADQYVEYASRRASTRVIAMFLETVRRPEPFRAALDRARARGIAMIALKVGRAAGAQEMIAAHSGALAGEDGAYEALFDAHGVHRVRTLEELVDAVELFSSPRRVAKGTGISSLHDSGGERVMFADLAADADVPFARISSDTGERMQRALDPGLVAANPLDAWGTGIDHERIFIECLGALSADAETAAVVFGVDLTRQGEPYDAGYLLVAREAFRRTEKPFCVLANLPSAVAGEEARRLRDEGIPVLEGTESGLRALRLLLDEREVAARPAIRPPALPDDAVRGRWRARLAAGGVSEVEAMHLLRDYGVPTIAARRVDSVEEAVAAADEMGWPVALKTAAEGVAHKSDVGGVRLDLADGFSLRVAYAEIAASLGPAMSVSPMAPNGVEMALGVVRDPQFGPLVLIAAGGVHVELLRDRRLAFPPLDVGAARRLIDSLRVRPLLSGARGAPAADVDSLAASVAAMAGLASDLGDAVEAVDANPLIVGPAGAVAVDALIVTRRAASA
jgi:acetate---CoA ligase (ADP-forming)